LRAWRKGKGDRWEYQKRKREYKESRSDSNADIVQSVCAGRGAGREVEGGRERDHRVKQGLEKGWVQ